MNAIATQMAWRPCEGFPAYEISDCGDMRNRFANATRKAGQRLRGFINFDGYLEYALLDEFGEKRHSAAHILVALTFIGPKPSPVHEVAHGNGSRLCNSVWNLRWATRTENESDTIIHGTARRGARNGRAKLSDADVIDIRREYAAIKRSRGVRRVSELDRKYGLSRGQIIRVAKGEAWAHLAEARS